MLRAPFLTCVFLVFGSAVTETSDLTARLRAIAAATSIDQADAKPWHLKLSASITSPRTRASESGSLEEWWSGPAAYRIVYDFPSYHATLLHRNGDTFLSPGVGRPPFLADYLLQQFIHPLPSDGELATGHGEENTQHFSSKPVQCIAYIFYPQHTSTVYNVIRQPYFCTEPGQTTLLISSLGASQRTLRDKLGTFQGHSVPIDLTVIGGGGTAAHAHLDRLEGQSEPYAEALSADGLAPTPFVANSRTPGFRQEKGIPGGLPLEGLSQNLATGTVFLDVIFGVDGKVKAATPIFYAEPVLIQELTAAVMKLKDRPFTVNGKPVEFEQVLHYDFIPR